MANSAQGQPEHQTIEGLGVRVGGVEGQIRDLKSEFAGLEKKFDIGMSQLGAELRSSISGLYDRLSMRTQPNLLVLISAFGVLASALTTVGYLALAPVQANVGALQRAIVPREEYDRRAAYVDRRHDDVAAAIEEIRRERYQEQRDTIGLLSAELRDVRARAASPPGHAVP